VSIHANGHHYPIDPNSPPELSPQELHDFKKEWKEAYGWEPRPHEIEAHRFYKHQRKLRELTGMPWAIDMPQDGFGLGRVLQTPKPGYDRPRIVIRDLSDNK